MSDINWWNDENFVFSSGGKISMFAYCKAGYKLNILASMRYNLASGKASVSNS